MPEARIAVAHGQMPERELEKVMRDFVAQRYNILLCSTIIETGNQIDALLEEIVDRFGKLPPQAQGLIDVHRLRVLSQPYGSSRWTRRRA